MCTYLIQEKTGIAYAKRAASPNCNHQQLTASCNVNRENLTVREKHSTLYSSTSQHHADLMLHHMQQIWFVEISKSTHLIQKKIGIAYANRLNSLNFNHQQLTASCNENGKNVHQTREPKASIWRPLFSTSVHLLQTRSIEQTSEISIVKQ